MRVWTDGAAHVIAGDEGIEVHRPKQASILHPLWKRARGSSPSRDVLAVVGQEPLRAWVGSGKLVRLFSLAPEAGVPQKIEAHVLDAIGLADGRVLACIADPGARQARLVVVDGDAPDLSEAREIALPTAPRIVWPGGIWTKDVVPWPEDDVEEGDEPLALDALAVGYPQPDGSNTFDEVQCFANEHGIVVTSVYAGLVVALPPDASQVDFAVRVPTQVGETEIFAARTKGGVCAVLCIEGRHAAIVHIAPDGRVLAHRSKMGREMAWGMGPPVILGDRVVVFEAGPQASNRLHDLKLQDLSISKSLDVGAGPSGRMSVWSAPSGEAFVLGLGATAYVATRDGRGRISCEALVRPRPPARVAERAAALGPQLAAGPPSLALAKAEAARVWEASVSEPLAIEIPFTNQGGKSQGVSVEVSGAAFEAGLVAPRQVRVGDAEAPLIVKGGVARAELPDVGLVAGTVMEYGRNKSLPPPEIIILRACVELTGVKAGSAILTVRIMPLRAAPGRGSVLQGKSITVRE
jgi:hypothetical protein